LHRFLDCGCKGNAFFGNGQTFWQKIALKAKNFAKIGWKWRLLGDKGVILQAEEI